MELSKLNLYFGDVLAYLKMLGIDPNKNVTKQEIQPGNVFNNYKMTTLNWTSPDLRDAAFNLKEATEVSSLQKLRSREVHFSRLEIQKQDIENISNFTEFKEFFIPVILNVIESLKTIKGYGPEELTTGNYYLSFDIPGSKGQYFRQNENGNLELRAFSDCVKLVS